VTDQAKPVSRPWQRCLRFSVRGLIVLVLVIGGWLGWVVRGARIQREAVRAITSSGSAVAYNWEWSNGSYIPGGKPWAPNLLVGLIGVDYFGHVTGVSLISSLATTDATIAEIAHLPRLQ
jgi:hypothetical protein